VGCDVVLDQEKFANASINAANQHDLFRKRNIGPAVEDASIRQERPPHLRPETIHPAMRERGRAIPHVGSVQTERPQSAPRIVEGRVIVKCTEGMALFLGSSLGENGLTRWWRQMALV
ncbi:hypothetical protein pipiens_018051, partial [Culex pipiens pipiens]